MHIRIKDFLQLILGIVLISVAVFLFRGTDLGSDSYTTMCIGLSYLTKFSFASILISCNILLFVVLFIKRRDVIHIGTILIMTMIGVISDFLIFLIPKTHFSAFPLAVNLIIVIIALIIFCYGIALYLQTNMGMSPYDAIGIVLAQTSKGKFTFSHVRIAMDLLCLVVGFALGGEVGISTILVSFLTGPLVTFFQKKLAKQPLKQTV